MSRSSLPSDESKRAFVREMFTGIARRYDFLNCLLSMNLDRRWRRFTATVARVPDGALVLDVCCGTGELALAMASTASDVTVIGTDFVQEMLEIGHDKVRGTRRDMSFVPVLGDALQMPFPDECFDVACVGFGIRNVAHLKQGVAEMARVTKPGGRVVILEFSEPRAPILRNLYMFYFRRLLPRIGNVISGSRMSAYTYLPESVLNFPNVDALADTMRECGLVNVTYHGRTLGIVTVHVGHRRVA